MSAPSKLIHGSGKILDLVSTRLALRLKAPAPKDFASKIDASPLVDLDRAADLFDGKKKATTRAVAHRPNLLWLRTKSDSPETVKFLEASAGENLRHVAPVYQLDGHGPEGLVLVDPEILLVTSPVPGEMLAKVLGEVGLVIDVARSKLVRPHWIVRNAHGGTILGYVEKLRDRFAQYLQHVSYDCVHLLETTCFTPDDTHYGQQTNLPRLGVDVAWNEGRGAGVRIALLDEGGLNLVHEDIDTNSRGNYQGWRAGSWGPTEAGGGGSPSGHATNMAGILWAATNDAKGVAGIADEATLYYLDVGSPASTTEVLAALTAAWANPPGGLRPHVIVFGHAGAGWDDPSIRTLLTSIASDPVGAVVCLPTGPTTEPEGPSNTAVLFPAALPGMVACGATEISGATDPRLAAGPSGEGSRYAAPSGGQGVTLVATGLDLFTTGEATNNAYVQVRGTSGAAATIGGIAALLRQKYPAFSAARIVDQLCRSVTKVGPYLYSEGPNGTDIFATNPEVGFGQVNAKQALDYADVYVRDGNGDEGQEPSNVPLFWAYSDVLIYDTAQAITDASFLPQPTTANQFHNPSSSAPAHAYVRVVNRGPGPANNVRVRLVLGESSTGWRFPMDWLHADDSQHVVAVDPNHPAQDFVLIGTIPAPTVNQPLPSAIAHFVINRAIPWLPAGTNQEAHICSMPSVRADNDYPFEATLNALTTVGIFGGEQQIRNNVAQRNLTVLSANSPWRFSFWVGRAAKDVVSHLHVDATKLRGAANLKLQVDPIAHATALGSKDSDAITLLDDTRFHLRVGAHAGVLTAKAGSRFEPSVASHVAVTHPIGLVPTEGVATLPASGIVQIRRPDGQPTRMNLEIPVPAGFGPTDFADVDLIERTADGRVLGGIRLRLVK